MSGIRIENLHQDAKISQDEMKKITGGGLSSSPLGLGKEKPPIHTDSIYNAPIMDDVIMVRPEPGR